ncbi:MAG: MFS transporter [Caulobacterales bacterium]|nr:MFS transporter [Caulobacterales bacterium]
MVDLTIDADQVAGRARMAPAPRHVLAVVTGNGLAFYDFLAYAYFAAQIGRTLFPAGQAGAQLLASLATFGVGFLMRPVGALVIGRIADRRGRRPAMLLSFGLMGLAMLGLALTPPFARIGMFAPALAVTFRLVQGFALGGELGASTAYLVEAAPAARRGFYVSLQFMSQDASGMVASLLGLFLATHLSETQLDAWGWRLVFAAGMLIVPVGLWLRNSLPETLEAPAAVGAVPTAEPAPLMPLRRLYVLGFLIIGCGGLISYVLTYFTTYATETLHMARSLGFAATTVVGLAGVVFDPIGGWLSDRYGRRAVMIWPMAVLVAAAIPAYVLIEQHRTAGVLLGLAGLLAAANNLGSVAALVAVTEAMPQRVRSGGLGLTYALGMCALGGSAQFMVAWLTQLTGSPLAPAFYLAAGGAMVLASVLAMPETAPTARRGRAHGRAA